MKVRAYTTCQDHKQFSVYDESDVTDETLVEYRVDSVAVKDASFGKALEHSSSGGDEFLSHEIALSFKS